MGLDWTAIEERYKQRLDAEEAAGVTPVERSDLRKREQERQERRRVARRKGPHQPKYDRTRMRELYEGGMSMHAVARVLGCDQWTVSKALRAIGVQIRPTIHAAPLLTHCKRGHEFTEDNTYINPTTGARICRACVRYREGKQSEPRPDIEGRRTPVEDASRDNPADDVAPCASEPARASSLPHTGAAELDTGSHVHR